MDSMSAAATSAAARKQELEQSQKALQQARQKIDRSRRNSRSACKPLSSLENARKKRIDTARATG
jgi:hypothetical protein